MTDSFSISCSHWHPLPYSSDGRNSWVSAMTKHSRHSKPYPAPWPRAPTRWLPMEVDDFISSHSLRLKWWGTDRLHTGPWLPTLPVLSWCWNAGLPWHVPEEHCSCLVRAGAEVSPSSLILPSQPVVLLYPFNLWHLLMAPLFKAMKNILTDLCAADRQRRRVWEAKKKKEPFVNSGPISLL